MDIRKKLEGIRETSSSFKPVEPASTVILSQTVLGNVKYGLTEVVADSRAMEETMRGLEVSYDLARWFERGARSSDSYGKNQVRIEKLGF